MATRKDADLADSNLRQAARALLLAGMLCALWAVPALAQQDEEDGIGIPPDLRRDLFPEDGSGGEANRIIVPRDRSLEIALAEADAAATKGNLEDAAKRYLAILDRQRDPQDGRQLVQRVGPEGPVAPARYLSYGRLVRERLYALPEEGRAAFRALADGAARALYEKGVKDASRRDLELVWRTYPVASVADDALERLGDLALEAADGALARDRYERAASLPGGDIDPARIARKIEAAKALERAASRAAAGRPGAWPTFGGRNDHAAPLPRIPGMGGEPRFTKPLPPSRPGREWSVTRGRGPRVVGERSPFVARGIPYAEIRPAVAAGRMVVVTERAASCYGIETGERHWYQTPWSGKEYEKSANLFYGATIAGGRVFAPFIDRILPPEFYRGIPVKEDLPHRRLVAFDLETGKRLWDLADSKDRFLKQASFALPPIERDGVLYAGATLLDGSIKTYLVALDAATGKLIWRRFLGSGQIQLTMFGEPSIEPLAMMPAESKGTIYHCTAFGVVAAVAAATGEIEWLSTYETIPLEAAQTYYARERTLVWRNVPPAVVDGVVVVTPIDAEKAFGIDADTGEARWALDNGGDRRLLGIDGGRAIFQGERIRAVDARTGKLVLALPAHAGGSVIPEEETGHGLVAGGEALVPTATRIVRIDLREGRLASEIPIPGGLRESGSLVAAEGALILTNPQRISVFPVREQERETPR